MIYIEEHPYHTRHRGPRTVAGCYTALSILAAVILLVAGGVAL